MTLPRVAACLGLLCSVVACGGDETPRDVEVTLGTARVSARMEPADGLVDLEATAQMVATVDMTGVTVEDVVLRALPDGPEISFDVAVRGPRDTATIDLTAEDTVVARISNAATTNAQVLPFCGSAASLTVFIEVEGLMREATRDLTVTCS
ncbi:MAG: hypothetical protein ACE37F_12255 [Nannocystaceae bacterium]|nr:hypothetical protein [bacterium]